MSAGIEFDTEAFLSGLQSAVVKLKVRSDFELNELGESIKALAKQKVAVDTGHTRDSIFSEPGEDVRGHCVDIGSREPVATFLEYGTVPHKIRIRDKSVLTDGETFFGKEVNHPGTTAQPFLEPAFMEGIARWTVSSEVL